MHFLGDLVGPEAEGSTCTIHDDVGTQTAQNTRLVVLAGPKVRDDGIIRIGQMCSASWASSGLITSLTSQS